ncbi:MAG TPA: PEP-CTERM system histidine kinase PrsK, partial [Gammaproteobacteria bacterium]|nr:PEP-CTERM system histidine kinase PrsK [Gammaproteobacteria bacterium]
MLNIGVVSYSASTLAFMALSLVMLTGWRGRLHGALLTTAGVVTAAWAFAAAYNAGTGYPSSVLVPFLEIARNIAWAVFLLRLLIPSPASRYILANWRIALAITITAICCIGLISLLLYPSVVASVLSVPERRDGRILGHLILAVVGLVLVEQLYRNTLPERRWAIKFLCI